MMTSFLIKFTVTTISAIAQQIDWFLVEISWYGGPTWPQAGRSKAGCGFGHECL